MQRQKYIKFAVVIVAALLLELPKTFASKKQHRKQGQATTRGPPPSQASQPSQPAQPANSQAANQDAAKLSYGNQGPPPPYQSHSQPGPPQNQGPPPPYQQSPGGYQQQQPQPVIINHVQQPQSGGGGGLGTAGGLAVGKS